MTDHCENLVPRLQRETLSGSPCSLWLLMLLLGLLFYATISGSAFAYPQYVGRGQFHCMDCHYSPTGGGLTNAWGRQSREVHFEADQLLGANPDDWWGHADASFDTDTSPQPEALSPGVIFDVGAEARLLSLVDGATKVVIPMLFEAGAVATYGRLQVYGTASSRKGFPGLPLVVHSREHWLAYAFSDEMLLRAGRLVLPFGLRIPDHTQFVRQDMGFGPWNQSYGLELDWTGEAMSLSLATYGGDLPATPARLRERGVAVRTTYLFGERLQLGLGARLSRNDVQDSLGFSGSMRWQIASEGYLLAELAHARKQATLDNSTLRTTTGYVRAGFFVLPELDIYIEWGHRQVREASWLARKRASVGANFQTWSWLELIPLLQWDKLDGVDSRFAGLLQAHFLY